MMFFQKYLDIHSALHFVGCGYLTFIMHLRIESIFISAILGFGLGVIWEAYDEMNYRNHWHSKFLDPRGSDIGDILTDLVGVLVAVLFICFL